MARGHRGSPKWNSQFFGIVVGKKLNYGQNMNCKHINLLYDEFEIYLIKHISNLSYKKFDSTREKTLILMVFWIF